VTHTVTEYVIRHPIKTSVEALWT